jgi:hypothetical protein
VPHERRKLTGGDSVQHSFDGTGGIRQALGYHPPDECIIRRIGCRIDPLFDVAGQGRDVGNDPAIHSARPDTARRRDPEARCFEKAVDVVLRQFEDMLGLRIADFLCDQPVRRIDTDVTAGHYYTESFMKKANHVVDKQMLDVLARKQNVDRSAGHVFHVRNGIGNPHDVGGKVIWLGRKQLDAVVHIDRAIRFFNPIKVPSARTSSGKEFPCTLGKASQHLSTLFVDQLVKRPCHWEASFQGIMPTTRFRQPATSTLVKRPSSKCWVN